MIKKLRIRFIIVSMLSVLFVLTCTIGAINIYNIVTLKQGINYSLDTIVEKGLYDFPPEEPKEPIDDGPLGPEPDFRGENYFVVTFLEDGSIDQYNFHHIFFISEEEGKRIATEIYNSNVESGRIDKLFYKRALKDNVTYIACLDAKESLDYFYSFLNSSIVISAISYAVIFVLIFFSSKLVFRVSEESYRKQKEFVTNASHELKTPLTIISTDVDIIEMDEGKTEWTSSIKDQVERLTKMTNQLVTLSKLEEPDISKYPFETISLSLTLNECVDAFAPSFKKSKLELETDIAEDININANKSLLEELLSIFMDNALKYASKDGKVGVVLNKDKKNKVNLLFYNNIDSNTELNVDSLFDRFYRSSNTKKNGSGIGLSIAKEIINLFHATIKVNKDNNKITFLITF